MRTLAPLFSPRSIALVGATADIAKLSCVVLKNLLRFKGWVYPVTPAAPEVLARRPNTPWRGGNRSRGAASALSPTPAVPGC